MWETDYKKPNQTKLSANALLVGSMHDRRPTVEYVDPEESTAESV